MATTAPTPPPMQEHLGLPAGGSADASASAPGLPSLNPSDSPYQPLALPEAATPTQHPLPDQQPQQDLGAVSKGGAVAYMADKVLRGAIQGYDANRLQKAQQFNKKLTSLSALEKDLGQQYRDAYNEIGSSSPNATPEQILADPHVKQLHNQLLAVHQATQSAIQSYLPPLTTDKKTGKQKEKKNILQRMFDHQDNPDEALRAYSEAAQQLGPQAFYQVAQPAQLQAMYQQRQGKAADTAAGTAQAGAATAQAVTAEQKAKLEQEKLNPATTPERRAQIDELLTPLTARRPTADEMKRQDYTRLLETGQLPKDKQGNPLSYEAWAPYAAAQGRTAAAPPKAIKYDNNTGTVSDPTTGKTYTPNQLDLPIAVASMFKAADNQAFKKQQRSLQQIAARGQAYLMGKVVQVPDPLNPQQAIYKKAIDAIRDGDPTTASIWYKMEMPTGTERARADLAISAREQLNTMDQILQRRKDLFGPEAGRKTDLTVWIGSQDPDAQRFEAAARIAADHLAGVFGGRSKAALDAIHDAIGQNKTNPAAAVAALEQMNIAAAAIQGRGAAGGGGVPGTAPAHAAPAAPPPPAAKFDVTDPKGKIHHFDSQSQADHFKQLAGIK